MSPMTIAIAGFTSKVASLTTGALLSRHPDVIIHGISRSPDKVDPKIASSNNVKIFASSATDFDAIRTAVRGADICICCYLGDQSLMVDGQKLLIDACIQERVHRYMASDWSLDYRPLALGDIPNKDPMKHVRSYLEDMEKDGKIRGVHVLNGAFTEVAFARFPGWIDVGGEVFHYYGTGDEPIELTTIADAGAYTAEVAVDPTLTGYFNFCGDKISIKQMARIYEKVYGTVPKLERLGSLEDLRIAIQKTRETQPENVWAWVGMCYQYFLTNGSTYMASFDNERYPFIKPTTVEEFFKQHPKDNVESALDS